MTSDIVSSTIFTDISITASMDVNSLIHTDMDSMASEEECQLVCSSLGTRYDFYLHDAVQMICQIGGANETGTMTSTDLTSLSPMSVKMNGSNDLLCKMLTFKKFYPHPTCRRILHSDTL